MIKRKNSKYSGLKYLIVLLFILRRGSFSITNVSISIMVIGGILMLLYTIKNRQRSYEQHEIEVKTRKGHTQVEEKPDISYTYEDQDLDDRLWELKGLRNDDLISESKYKREVRKVEKKMKRYKL